MTERRNPMTFDTDETESLRAIGWQHPASPSSCPDSALLLAVDEGVLDDTVSARVREHVAGCATCQQLAKDLRVLLDEELAADVSARILARVSSPGSARHGQRTHFWLGAGTLALAASVVWFLFRPAQPPPPPESRTVEATPAPIPSVFVVDRPLIPPGDVDLTLRGDAPATLSLEDQIAAALDKADGGDVSGAIADLEGIAARNKSSRIAALALGASQVRAGRNEEAVVTLDRARTLRGASEAADEAGWFLGVALVRTGHPERARAVLNDVCQHGGPRGNSACAGVAEIDRTKSPR